MKNRRDLPHDFPNCLPVVELSHLTRKDLSGESGDAVMLQANQNLSQWEEKMWGTILRYPPLALAHAIMEAAYQYFPNFEQMEKMILREVNIAQCRTAESWEEQEKRLQIVLFA